jgi:hypothetical protein
MEELDAFALISIVAMVVAMGGLTLIEESGRRLATFAYLMTVLVLGLGLAFLLLYLGVLPS